MVSGGTRTFCRHARASMGMVSVVLEHFCRRARGPMGFVSIIEHFLGEPGGPWGW